jgi:DNA invertase Pin-like site-specific DNA recombinase
MPNQPLAYVYTRMSTPEQLKGDSLRRQLQGAANYADSRGLELTPISDHGVSAYRGANAHVGRLASFRQDVKRGTIPAGSFLIVESLDRLSRETILNAIQLLIEIINGGVIVVTLFDGKEYSTQSLKRDPYSLFLALISFATSGEESQKKSQRLGAAWGEKKRLGRADRKPLTKIVPSWLVLTDDRAAIEPVPERATLVREIFTLATTGWGSNSIARLFNERREAVWDRTKNKSGVWHESYVKKILANRAVLGEYQPHKNEYDEAGKLRRLPDGEPVTDYYPAIVDLTTFEKAQSDGARRRTGSGRKGKRYANLFTSLLRCQCGAGVRYIDKGQGPKGGQYLRCTAAAANGGCNATATRYSELEEYLLRKLEGLDLEAALGLQASESKAVRLNEDLADAVAVREESKRKLDRLMAAIFSDAEAAPRVLKAELSKTEALMDQHDALIAGLSASLLALKNVDPRAQRELLDRLIAELRSSAADDVSARRVLASEIQKIVKRITFIEESANVYDPASQLQSSDENEWDITDHSVIKKIRISYHSGLVQELVRGDVKEVKIRASKKHLLMLAGEQNVAAKSS